MDVEATDLGIFTDSGYFHCLYQGRTVCCLAMKFIHTGVPQMQLPAKWTPPLVSEPAIAAAPDYSAMLEQLLGRLNICSKESVVRRYDHEVQAGTVVKPLTGVCNDGPSDAAVFRPLLDSFEGVVVAHGICPSYSDIDTYHMMACAIDEGLRNYVATGGNIEHVAGLDNFCWCDPVLSEKTPDGPYKAAQLVRANQALYDYCVAFGVPLISGKDSMKNDYQIGDRKISIPPTVLFSVIGKIADVRLAVTMDVKKPGDLVYLLGRTEDELGGSQYYAQLGHLGANVPKVDAAVALQRYRTLNQTQQQGLLASCHDLSDGGLAVALAESAFAGGFGMDIDLSLVDAPPGLRADKLLFSESQSRLLVTVQPHHQGLFEELFRGQSCALIGKVVATPELKINAGADNVLVQAPLERLKSAWQATLKEM
jgi:phosphoribosylformylglycinamidine synthase